jgi:hypothetical protein
MPDANAFAHGTGQTACSLTPRPVADFLAESLYRHAAHRRPHRGHQQPQVSVVPMTVLHHRLAEPGVVTLDGGLIRLADPLRMPTF